MLKNAYGRYLQHHELYPLLGLKPGQHLPYYGFEVIVRGVHLRCDPASQKGRRSKHRLKVLCSCGRYIPFGRYGQHHKACQKEKSL
jgi:hypothetical protein